MLHLNRISIFTVALICSLAGLTLAQATQPAESPEATKVRAAAKSFMVMLSQQDIAPARAHFAGTADDMKMVQQMHDMLQSAQHFRSAAEAKWPDSFTNGRNSDVVDPKVMIERLEHEVIKVEGDTATFRSGLQLKQIKGEWQVVDLMSIQKNKETMLQIFGTLASAADETAAEVDRGIYKSFSDAKAAMGAKVRKKMAESAPATPAGM